MSGELERGARALLDIAVAPAFAEIRNLLVPLRTQVALASDACRDLEPVLGDGTSAQDLRVACESLFELAKVLEASVLAVESAVQPDGSPAVPLATVLTASDRLAHHHTKLVGGVRWGELSPSIEARRSPALLVTTLGAIWSRLAWSGRAHTLDGGELPGIHVGIQSRDDGVVAVATKGPGDAKSWSEIAAELRPLCAPFELSVENGSIELRISH